MVRIVYNNYSKEAAHRLAALPFFEADKQLMEIFNSPLQMVFSYLLD